MSGGNSEPFTLRHINSSTPQVNQAPSSQHSIAAADDYESAHTSRPGSSDSNEGLVHSSGGTHIPRHFSTPPTTPPRSPEPTYHLFTASQQATSTVGAQATGDTDGTSTVRAAESSNGRIRRKPVGSNSTGSVPRLSQMSETSDVTANTDDTPYIHFAIDQLTRDEEVRGSRRYPAAVDGQSQQRSNPFADPAPTSRENATVPMGVAPEPVLALDPQTRESRAHFDARLPSVLTPAIATEGPVQPEPSTRPDPITQKYLPAPPEPVAAPYPPRVSSRPDYPETQQPRSGVLVPYDEEVPSLRATPLILRPTWLAVFLLLCILFIIGLIFSGSWSATHLGLFGYGVFGDARYFVFEYLPTMLGMFMLLWVIQIQTALQRVTPFVAMASMSATSRSHGPTMEMQPTNFLLPRLSYFSAGQPAVGFCMLVFWLQIFTVPLLACVYNVYLYTEIDHWQWNTVQGIVWTLLALYVLLALAVITLIVWSIRRHTGLRWDVTSLADLMSLVERSNTISAYSHTEAFATTQQFKKRFANRSDRLGLWQTSSFPNEPFYTLGEEGADTRRYSLERGKIREKEQVRSSFPPDTPTTAGAGHGLEDVDLESDDAFDRIRYRYLPWYLRPSIVLMWSLLGILLYLAFLIASFINQAVIHGFAPLTPVAPTPAGFSATNFLYSFIPALIAQFLFLAWLSVDYAFRRLQPYAAMSSNHDYGASATTSLLLDYPSRPPISIQFASLLHGDLRIFWFSTLSLIAASLPILAGGCFWAQFYVSEQQVRVAVQPAGYYTLCVFLALYAFSLPLVLIGLRKRRLPHACTTVAEQISWLYQSNVLGGREWRALLGSKTEVASRLRSPATEKERGLLSGGEGRFIFGKFTGKDGNVHLGIERVGRGGSGRVAERAFREGLPRPGAMTASGRNSPAVRVASNQQRFGAPETPATPEFFGEPRHGTPPVGTPFQEKVEGGFGGILPGEAVYGGR